MERIMMIVDDIEMNRAILKKIFQGEFSFLEAESGEEAIAMLQNQKKKIDIMILDISMPGISGIELLRQYGRQPYLNGVPVVVVTSSDKTEDQLEAFDAGANDFITKPFNAHIVRTRVQNVWASSEKLQEIEHEKQILKARATRDAMTGLLNKPSAQENIRECLKHNPNGTHALLMIDIDNFKGVNDSKGHLAGDRVIKLVARELNKIFNKESIISRFGGDEFCVFIADVTDKNVVRNKAQELSGAIMLQSDQEASVPFSVSVGLAFSDGTGCTCEELTGCADEALYTSKENGKARVSEYQFGGDQTAEITEVNEADAHMRNLLNRIPTGVGVMYFYPDKKMRFGYFNDSFYAMLGESRAERQHYIGYTAFESVHPEDVPRAMEEARKIISQGCNGCVEVRLRHSDGTYRWYQAQAALTERTEEFSTLYLSFLDINHQRMQQLELSRKQAMIDVSTEHGNIGLWRFNLDTKQIVQDYSGRTLDGIDKVVEDVPQSLIESGIVHHDSANDICRCYDDILSGKHKSECTVQIRSLSAGNYEWRRIVLVRQPDSEEYGRTAVGFSMDVDHEINAQKKAQENENVLALALDFSGMFSWTYDVQQGIVYLGDTLQKKLDMPRVNENYPECILEREIIHPRYASLFRKKTAEIKNGADGVDFEVQVYGPSGELHWMRLRICALHKADGVTQTAVCTCAVIDTEKTMESRVRLEQERTRNEESSMTAHVVADLSSDLIIENSSDAPNAPLMAETACYSENIAAAQASVVYDDDREVFRKNHDARHLMDEFAQGHTAYVIEFRRRQRDGMIRWTRNVMHLVEDPATMHIYLYEYCYDINATKSVEVVTNAAILLTYDCLASIDLKHGQTSYMRQDNVRRGENVIIADYPSTVKQYIETTVMPEDRERCSTEFESGHIQYELSCNPVYEVTFHTRDEAGNVHLMRHKYAYYDRKKMRCLMMRTDVTEIVREEEEKRRDLEDALAHAKSADHAKGVFLSRMTHELNTPLNAILGYSELAKEHCTDPDKVVHYMDNSRTSALHLLAIINDVLDISAIENGRMKLERVKFDLPEMINALAGAFADKAAQKNIDFAVDMEKLKSSQIYGDPQRLRQVLSNLLSNAVKFTPGKGRVSLGIRQMGIIRQKLHLQFRIEDTGIGIRREVLDNMFRPFEQAGNSMSSGYGGTGLGLSISYYLVRMMGGTLDAVSEPGNGSTFTVTLAFDMPEPDDACAPCPKKDMRALALSSDEYAAVAAQAMFEELDIRCDVITNAKKAIRRALNRMEMGNPYDICLIDMDHEECAYMQTAAQLREQCGDKAPFIAGVTADVNALNTGIELAGISRVMAKPLTPDALRTLISEMHRADAGTAEQNADAGQLRGMKVLLAEDNAMNMEIATDILKKAGIDVVAAYDGKKAEEIFAASAPGTFDAILMDIQMPVMNGYEATRAIRAGEHAQAKTIPVIAMTANAMTQDVTQALAAGMNDHVSKPVSFEKLYAVLCRLIKRIR